MTTPRLAKGLFLAGVAFAAMAVQPSAAQAQDTPPQAAERDDGGTSGNAADIVVTARRVEERLQDVPLSVTAFGSEELDKRAIERPTDLIKMDPALVVTPGTPATRFSPYIRGQAPSAGAAAPESVVVYVAEAPKITPSFYDLSNIQVIKGPQGTLFGETATGGVLLFGPQKPKNDFGGYVEGQLGNHHFVQVEGALNVPIFRDLWSVRVAGQIRKRDGYTRILYSRPVAGGDDADNLDYKGFRISSLITPADNFRIYTLFERSWTQSNGTGTTLHAIYDATSYIRSIPNPFPLTAAGTVTSNRFLYFTGYAAPQNRSYLSLLQDRLAQQTALGPRAFTANYDLSLRQDTRALINQVEWNVTDHVTFKNISAISQVRSGGSGFHIDGTDLPIIDSTPQVCVSGVSPDDCKSRGPKTWSTETRLNGDLLDNRITWQLGGYYRKIPAVYTGPSGSVIIAASPTSIPLASTPVNLCMTRYNVAAPCTELTKTESDTYAGYGQVTWRVFDGVSLTGGFRRTWDHLQTTTTAGKFDTVTFNGQAIPQSVLGTKPLPGAGEIVVEVPRKHYDTYTLGADWKVTDDVLLYATHRKGHKTGGVNPGAQVGDPNRFYGPESVTDWEVGFKGSADLGAVKLSGSVALFSSDYSDIQRRTSTQTNGTLLVIVANVAKARIRGLELSANMAIPDYFDLNVQYSYLDAKFQDWKELTNCSADLTPTGCQALLNAGTPTATLAGYLVNIDHTGGTKTVTQPGTGAIVSTDRFRPDLFANAPKHRLVVQPSLHLGFIGPRWEGATLSSTISYLSSSVSTDSNFSLLVPAKDLIQPGRTTVDLRFDWKNFAHGNGITVDWFIQASNLFDKTYVINRSSFINLCGCITDQFSEPRMVFGGIRAKF